MKYIELFNINEALKALGNLLLPAKVGIKISRLQRQIRPAVEEYITERDKLIISHGDLQEEGSYKIRRDEKVDYDVKMKELNEMESDIELSNIEKIELNGELNIQPAVLFYLQDYVIIS